MSRRFYVAVILTLVMLASSSWAQSSLPAVSVALVQDGPETDQDHFADGLQEELKRLLAGDFHLSFETDTRFAGDYTLVGVNAALDAAFDHDNVDLIICTGFIGSTAAMRRTQLRHPTIASFALSTKAQALPLVNDASGVKNLTYVLSTLTLSDEVAALHALVPDARKVVVLGSNGFFEALPDANTSGPGWQEGDVSLKAVRAGDNAEEALSAIPDDTDAIMLPPLIGFSDEDVSRLLDGLKQKHLPTVSLVGEAIVAQGALVGTTPRDWSDRVIRRVSLNARKILSGQDASALPVTLISDGDLFINLSTARAIGVFPPFSVMIDAVVLDAERDQSRRLTMQLVMNEAMKQNKDLAVAAAALAAAREELGMARARLLPNVDVSLAGTLLDEDRASAARRPSEQSTTVKASLTQVLWSDDVWAGYEVQKRLIEQQEAEYEQTRLDVVLDAVSAYFQVLRAFTAENIQRSNLQHSRQNLQRARLRVRLGDANRAEVLRWESKIATEKAEVIGSIVTRNVAEMELNRTLGRPLEESMILAVPDLSAQLSMLLDPRVSRYMTNAWDLRHLREYATEYAVKSSPEITQLLAGIAAQKRIVTNTKREFYIPDATLSFGWSRYLDESGAGSTDADRPGWSLDDTEWNAAIIFSLPLFQGGQRFAERNQAGQELLRLRARHAATSERIEQRIRTALHKTSSRLAAIDLTRQAATASGENLDLVNDSYSRGAVDLITLLDAQTSALQADLAAADATYSFLLDLMETERASGAFSMFSSETQREAWLLDLELWFANQEH